MSRSNWVDIQFQRADSEDVRLEKLRRMSQAMGELARTLQLIDANLQLTNDATGSVTLNGGNAQLAVTIANGAVSNNKLASMAANTIKGRIGGAGPPLDLTPSQVAGLVNSSLDHGTLQGLADDDHPQYVLRTILNADGDLLTRIAGNLVPLAIGSANQLLRVVGGAPAWATISPTVTLGTDLSGAVTLTDLVSGTLNATVVNNAITNAKLADMAQATVKGRAAGAGTGDPTDLSAAQLAAIVNTALDHGALTGLADDDHPQYPLEAGIETITGTWTFSNVVTAPAVNGSSTLQLQVAGTTQQNMTATQNSWALGTSVPATSITRHVFGASGNGGIEIATLNGAPRWVAKRYNGAYATPTRVLNTNTLNLLRTEGYQETTGAFVAFATLDVVATEDWISTANGHKTTLRSTANGSTTASATLALQGAQAQFLDGTAALPAQTWANDLDTGRYRIGADQMGDSCGTVLQMEYGATYSDQKTQARWTGVNSPAQLVANTNDFTGAAGNFTVVRFSTDAARNITGATGGVAGRLVLFINIGTQTAVFTHNDAASTAGNRFLNANGVNKTVQAGGSFFAWYDGTSAAWRQIASIA